MPTKDFKEYWDYKERRRTWKIGEYEKSFSVVPISFELLEQKGNVDAKIHIGKNTITTNPVYEGDFDIRSLIEAIEEYKIAQKNGGLSSDKKPIKQRMTKKALGL